jgi:hypothetical protein
MGPANHGQVRNLAVSVYDLTPSGQEQVGFSPLASPKRALFEAMDRNNTAEANLWSRRRLGCG